MKKFKVTMTDGQILIVSAFDWRVNKQDKKVEFVNEEKEVIVTITPNVKKRVGFIEEIVE